MSCRPGSRTIILQNVDLAQKQFKLSAATRSPRTHFCFYSPNFIVNRSIYETINQQKYFLLFFVWTVPNFTKIGQRLWSCRQTDEVSNGRGQHDDTDNLLNKTPLVNLCTRVYGVLTTK